MISRSPAGRDKWQAAHCPRAPGGHWDQLAVDRDNAMCVNWSLSPRCTLRVVFISNKVRANYSSRRSASGGRDLTQTRHNAQTDTHGPQSDQHIMHRETQGGRSCAIIVPISTYLLVFVQISWLLSIALLNSIFPFSAQWLMSTCSNNAVSGV